MKPTDKGDGIMSTKRTGFIRGCFGCLAASLAVWALAAWCAPVVSQNLGFGFQQAVGGVFVDGFGVLNDVQHEEFDELCKIRMRDMQPQQGDLVPRVGLRKISLRQLQAAISEARDAGKPIPDEVRFLGGIQRIQYVFVYPEQRDIVLAGEGEGWRVDNHGNFVGKTTGRPVIELDDLLVALRTAESAAQGGISCSIDPTAEGLKRVEQFINTLPMFAGDPKAAADALEQAMGPQKVTIRGVPTNSHFAAVLLVADYRMKRLGMGFEKAPVKGLPSYLQMLGGSAGSAANMLPRWWMASDYKSLLRDKEGLAWELRGQGVKAMSEEDYVAANGERKPTGKSNKKAAEWAEKMTEKYEELSVKEPIFGELRNCIDLAVISALMVKENLASKAGCDLSLLMDPARLPLKLQLQAVRQLPAKANYIETKKNFVISASGGVLVNSWSAADKQEESADLSSVRSKAADGHVDRWWWN
jgi:hypothetical protein